MQYNPKILLNIDNISLFLFVLPSRSHIFGSHIFLMYRISTISKIILKALKANPRTYNIFENLKKHVAIQLHGGCLLFQENMLMKLSDPNRKKVLYGSIDIDLMLRELDKGPVAITGQGLTVSDSKYSNHHSLLVLCKIPVNLNPFLQYQLKTRDINTEGEMLLIFDGDDTQPHTRKYLEKYGENQSENAEYICNTGLIYNMLYIISSTELKQKWDIHYTGLRDYPYLHPIIGTKEKRFPFLWF